LSRAAGECGACGAPATSKHPPTGGKFAAHFEETLDVIAEQFSGSADYCVAAKASRLISAGAIPKALSSRADSDLSFRANAR
jgi:hypothetical protein